MSKPQDEADDVGSADILHLVQGDQIRFAEALIHPPKLSERWARAAQRHSELIAEIEGLRYGLTAWHLLNGVATMPITGDITGHNGGSHEPFAAARDPGIPLSS